MLSELSAPEFYMWQAFEMLSPQLEDRSDLHTAMIVSTLMNSRYGTREKPNPFRVAQFMPEYGKDRVPEGPKPEHWRTMKAVGQMIAAAFKDYKEEPQPKRTRRR